MDIEGIPDNDSPRVFGVQCMEQIFPGMWQRWFRAQCAAVGWPDELLNGRTSDQGWVACRNRLAEMRQGDWVVVQLRGRRLARLGEIIRLEVEDSEWSPLARPTQKRPDGGMGRRVLVRWDLEEMPDDPDVVVRLPASVTVPSRHTINRFHDLPVAKLQSLMRDPKNWVNLSKKFGWEKELSSYIGAYPHRLEDGMLPFPDSVVCEKRMRDGTRIDVLLEDAEGRAVVVECKQHSPTISDVKQLRGYMQHIRSDVRGDVRGILCHGGARMVQPGVRRFAEEIGNIEFVSYRLDVRFSH